MITPAEYISRHVTPLIRELALHYLLTQGHSQNKLARLTGLSQPMLWKIQRKDPQMIIKRLSEMGIPSEDIEAMKTLLAKSLINKGAREAARRLLLFEHSLIARGLLCESYAEATGLGRDSCQLFEMYPPPRDKLLEELLVWFKSLSEVPRVHLYLPQVGSNLVLAEEEAENHMQTVAFPGRIVSVGSRLRAIGDPAYGASLHTARVLLSVRRADPSKRAAFVLRFENDVSSRLYSNGVLVCRVESYSSEEELIDAVRKEAVRKGSCDVIEALPVPGVEPVLYVIASGMGKLLSMLKTAVGMY